MIIMEREGTYVERDDLTEEEFYQTTYPLKGWTIYTGPWPIPPAPPTFDEAQQAAYSRIKQGFSNAIENGQLTSQTKPNWLVDCRRNGRDADLDNLTNMIDMVTKGIVQPPVLWKGVTEYQSCALAELQSLQTEMQVYGAQVYQHKHEKEFEISQCTTVEECEAIVW